MADHSTWMAAPVSRTTEHGTAALARPIPLYVGYFTSVLNDQGEIESYVDIYGGDGPVVAALVVKQVANDANP